MTTGMIRDLSILGHMLDYCCDIENAVQQYGNDIDIFSQNRTYKHAVSMCIMQIGELTNKLSKEFQSDYPEIDWRSIRGMRNHFAHGYWEMNTEKIWESVHQIPELKHMCENVLEINKDVVDVSLFRSNGKQEEYESDSKLIDDDMEL